jgi:hypothetical protein
MLLAIVAGLAAALLAGLSVIVAIDPYDTGRFGVPGVVGVPEFGQPLRNASIARRDEFSSALIGNSTLQLINPANISSKTDGRFASLTMLGGGPLEEMAMAEWFVHNHKGGVWAMVIGIDEPWCQPAGEVKKGRPFPFWLYSRSNLTYLAGSLRFDSLKHAVVRVAVWAGYMKGMRADGFEDYEKLLPWTRDVAERELAKPRPVPAFDSMRAEFPAVSLLHGFVAQLEPSTRVLMVILPRYHRSLPAAGSNHYQMEAACKERLVGFAAGRARTAVLDLLRDDEHARSIDNWWDNIHYRGQVAREIEMRIVSSLSSMR